MTILQVYNVHLRCLNHLNDLTEAEQVLALSRVTDQIRGICTSFRPQPPPFISLLPSLNGEVAHYVTVGSVGTVSMCVPFGDETALHKWGQGLWLASKT